jgi:hypothetical protein
MVGIFLISASAANMKKKMKMPAYFIHPTDLSESEDILSENCLYQLPDSR